MEVEVKTSRKHYGLALITKMNSRLALNKDTQEHTLISEGNTREILATLPNMSHICIQVDVASMQYLPHYPKHAGNKHAISATLPETCRIASRQYLLHYPERASSKHAILVSLPKVSDNKQAIPTALS
jgi:hypothetical protein